MPKVNKGKNKLKISGVLPKEKVCNVPDFSVFFNFQYITSDKKFNFDYINKNDKKISKDLLLLLQKISQSSWEELRTKGKHNGGFEVIEYSNFKESIAGNIKHKKITKDTKLYVFRFGGDKYRMIGYKSNSCKAALHILGFDFNHTLYDRGN